ncbi:MAG: hypothetical protein M3H12_05490, partial [Chromatiales bacterium]
MWVMFCYLVIWLQSLSSILKIVLFKVPNLSWLKEIIYLAAFLREFQQARGARQALLFAYPDGSPMLRREFDVSLKQLLVFCGYQTSAF